MIETMERRNFLDLSAIEEARPLQVLTGFRNLSVLVEGFQRGRVCELLFRPESEVKAQWDPRIPVPKEIYRDVAFHRIDSLLGWNITAPVVPLTVPGLGPGVVRPFWREASQLPSYKMEEDFISNSDFWIKVAILDCACACIDRVKNDILIIKDGRVLIDSGMSFVDGMDFDYQTSFVREAFRNEQIPPHLLSDLHKLNFDNLCSQTKGLITMTSCEWVMNRTDRILKVGKVL